MRPGSGLVVAEEEEVEEEEEEVVWWWPVGSIRGSSDKFLNMLGTIMHSFVA